MRAVSHILIDSSRQAGDMTEVKYPGSSMQPNYLTRHYRVDRGKGVDA